MVASSTHETVVIGRRFCGPPNSGNGGYSCGVMARLIDGPASCTLKSPPPLDRPLSIELNGGVVMRDGEAVVGMAEPAGAPDLDVPALPSPDAVEKASRRYIGFRSHAFPGCFVCGPQREAGDGLRIFPGRLDGSEIVAAPWSPDSSLAGPDGRIGVEHVWAALDCPTWAAFAHDGRLALLARMTGQVNVRPRPGERCTILAWTLGSDGRKHRSAGALYAEDGALLAVSDTLWIEPKDPAVFM